VDVTVQPYFILKNTTFTKNTTNITAVVTVESVNTGLPLESVSLYVGNTDIVDQVNNAGSVTVVPDISVPVTLSITSTAPFARVGVKTAGVAELVYSQVEKL
jgi:hypothetical protein